jgi:hypothetical protein
MTGLAAGALGISVAFIKDIAPHPVYTGWLAVAYLGFGLALLLILFSFMFEQKAYRQQRVILDAIARNTPKERLPRNWWSMTTLILNISSVVVFIVGAIGIAMFAWLNIPS